MIIETMILSLLVGKLRGGKIRNLEDLYINGWYLFVVSFLIEIVTLLVISRGQGFLSILLENKFFYIHILIYLTLIIGLTMNWKCIGLRIVLFGSIINFLPIIFNNGKMPVLLNALEHSKLYNQISLLEEGRIVTHVLARWNTKLIILGDIIPIGKPYILPKIISVGDILIAFGLFLLIQMNMKRSPD